MKGTAGIEGRGLDAPRQVVDAQGVAGKENMNDTTAATKLAPPFTAGYFPDMASEVYHAVEAMSSSGAKRMIRSPAHYRLMRTTPNEPTEAMQFGTCVHDGVLEPDQFDKRVVCAPVLNRRTNAGKEAYAEFQTANAGRIVLSADDYARARRCVDAVRAHPAAAKLIEGGTFEASLFWLDAKFGVPCKSRLDIQNHGGITDLKTCQDASPEGFAKAAANLLYHVQGAFNISGCEHVLDASPSFFAFICVESEAPHAVACYTLPGAAVLAGGHLANVALERYADALAAGRWTGYPDTINPLPFPKWALRFNN